MNDLNDLHDSNDVNDFRNEESRRDPAAQQSPDASATNDAFSMGELDSLLREWHERNAGRAVARRNRLLDAISQLPAAGASEAGSAIGSGRREGATSNPQFQGVRTNETGAFFRRIVMHSYVRAAACLLLVVGLFTLVAPLADSTAQAEPSVLQLPDGGRLEAVDGQGTVLGPCPLKHTDVKIDVAGHFSRVTLTQTYTNSYPQKIEAVYTFPMSHRAAVDRMTMTVGDRVVVGEVKEREAARRIYEAARESGYVASLLEQERPNIFTQSIANIEPGATVEVQIAYIEMLESRDGVSSLAFPMVVGPRYIPGYRAPLPRNLPPFFTARRGLVRMAPGTVEIVELTGAESIVDGPRDALPLTTGAVAQALDRAVAIESPSAAWWDAARAEQIRRVMTFVARNLDGSGERGELYVDAAGVTCGQINGRWFFCPPPIPAREGTGVVPGTDQVPDAARITPMPTRPPMRAGHDVSLTVRIDTGGPGVVDVRSELHEVATTLEGRVATVALRNQKEIPNRDFVLSWRTTATGISEGVFTCSDPRAATWAAGGAPATQPIAILHPDGSHITPSERLMMDLAKQNQIGTNALIPQAGGFVTVVLNPPPRSETFQPRARELIFVLDTSGSMNGFPIDKAKEVMSKAIASMRPDDTFNMITFAGQTKVLWPEPRPASEQNRAEAQAFLTNRQSGGGTEMMKAIEAALVQKGGAGGALDPLALANQPADGRTVTVVAPVNAIEQNGERFVLRAGPEVALPLRLSMDLPTILNPQGVNLRLTGQWLTEQGQRLFAVREVAFAGNDPVGRMRICMFLTDGFVGNDQAIVQAVRDNAGTTRVFSFGIGNSVNRFLLEQLALAGRGECEFVTLAEQGDPAVERFTRRIQSPVLTDIAIRSDGIQLLDLVAGTPSTAPGLFPDLYDVKPLVFHARYTGTGSGTITVTGRTAAGPFERTIPIALPAQGGDPRQGLGAGNDALPALWARSTVERTLAPHGAALEQGNLPDEVKRQVIALGETFSIMTPFTSFVAVEKARMTLGGRPTLVAVPIELPQGLRWESFFHDVAPQQPAFATRLGAEAARLRGEVAQPESGRVDEAEGTLEAENVALAARYPDVLTLDAPVTASVPARGAPAPVAPAPAAAVVPPTQASPPPPAPSPVPSPSPQPVNAPPADPGGRGFNLADGKPSAGGVILRESLADARDKGGAPRSRNERERGDVLASAAVPRGGKWAEAKQLYGGGGGGGSGDGSGVGGGTGRGSGSVVVRGGIAGDAMTTAPAGETSTGARTNRGIITPPLDHAGAVESLETMALGLEMRGDRAEREGVDVPATTPHEGGASVMYIIAPSDHDGARYAFGQVDLDLHPEAGGDASRLTHLLEVSSPPRFAELPALEQSKLGAALAIALMPSINRLPAKSVELVEAGGIVAITLNSSVPKAAETAAAATQVQVDLVSALSTLSAAPGTGNEDPKQAAAQAVTVAEPSGAELVVYDVRDLTALPWSTAEATARRELELAAAITELIDHEGWSVHGGTVSDLRGLNGALVIRSSAEVHRGIAALLGAIRQVFADEVVDGPGIGAGSRSREITFGSQRVRTVDVRHLLRADDPVHGAARLAAVVELVDPERWRNAGGEGVVVVAAGALLLVNSPTVLDRVELLLDQLSRAAGVELPEPRRKAAEAAQRRDVKTSQLLVHPCADLITTASASSGESPLVLLQALAGMAASINAIDGVGATPLDMAPVGFGSSLVLPASPDGQRRLEEWLNSARAESGLPALELDRTPAMAAEDSKRLRDPADDDDRRARFRALRGVLSPQLFAQVVAIEDPTCAIVDCAKLATVVAGEGVAAEATAAPQRVPDGTIEVRVLLDSLDRSARRALEAEGLAILATNDRFQLVVGHIAPRNLGALALVDGVRKVE